MASWNEIAVVAPELSEAVRTRFDSYRHLALATLRRDGSPRISGNEVIFHDDELWLGMMDGSRKARDLQRDPRFALHSAMVDIDLVEGDAKIGGRAIEVTEPGAIEAIARAAGERNGQDVPQPFHLFRADITELVLTRVEGDLLVIESWHEGVGLRRVKRH